MFQPLPMKPYNPPTKGLLPRNSLSVSVRYRALISGVGKIVLIWLAAAQVLDGNFTSGMLVAFISFSDQFISRSAGLINALIDFKMLCLHGERLADIVLSEKNGLWQAAPRCPIGRPGASGHPSTLVPAIPPPMAKFYGLQPGDRSRRIDRYYWPFRTG